MTEKFEFKRNAGVQALVQGRKTVTPDTAGPVRSKHISAYLTEAEYTVLQSKLDGRPASSIVRKLILTYIGHGQDA